MKNIITIIFFFLTIFIYADENFYIKKNILVNNGYIEFDIKEYYDTQLFNESFSEIFQTTIWETLEIGIKCLRLDIDDGFVYNLFYILDEDLPNILVIVYLENNGIIHGYYKKNIFLTGLMISTNHGDILAFF